MMDDAFAAQALAEAASDEQVNGVLFQHTGAHGGFHGVPRADFQHHRFHAAQIEQVREQQARRTCADDRDLCLVRNSHSSERGCVRSANRSVWINRTAWDCADVLRLVETTQPRSRS